MFNSILIVCVGNICRSPAAEGALIDALKQNNKLADKKISSAGIQAMVGKPADPYSIEIMQEQGIDISAHKAQQLTKQMISAADLILVMEQRHLEDITKMAPQARGKTMLLAKWLPQSEIPDPYKQQRSVFEYSIELINKAVNSWVKYL